MKKPEEIKIIVKEKYGRIAESSQQSGCCGETASCCGGETELYNIMTDEYSGLKGYVPDADLGLGCGLPTEYAGIKKGDVVVDLGSGAGNDVFIARNETGETGFVIGVDMTEEMIKKARRNKIKTGYSNVEFRLGEIENLPVEENSTDVVISNCVLNLVPDKEKAFSEIFRILKPGGHFCVSDIVIKGNLPEEVQKSAELYAGCISGAVDQDEYLAIIEKTGFKNIEIKKSKRINLPDEMLKEYLTEASVKEYYENMERIFSVTVTGVKKNG